MFYQCFFLFILSEKDIKKIPELCLGLAKLCESVPVCCNCRSFATWWSKLSKWAFYVNIESFTCNIQCGTIFEKSHLAICPLCAAWGKVCGGQRLTAVPSAEWEPHSSEMRRELLLVISQWEFGLHNNTFDFMNHSRGSVQVIQLVTFLKKKCVQKM